MTGGSEKDFSALGFWNFGQSYFEAAEYLVKADSAKLLRLAFDAPIRALLAQVWELTLKACLLRQGHSHEDLRKKFRHNLLKAFHAVDRERFAQFRLDQKVGDWLPILNDFHQARRHAYPLRGLKTENTLVYMIEATRRFSLPRETALSLFGSP